MHAALEQDLWHAANSLQLKTAGRSACGDTLPALWPGGAGKADVRQLPTGGLPGHRAHGVGPLQGPFDHATAVFTPSSPPLIAPVPVRLQTHVLGTGASAFRPTAAALQNQWQANQALQLLHERASVGRCDAAIPAVHRYDSGLLPSATSPARSGMHSDGLHSPPQCRVSLASDKAGQARTKPQINITASCVTGPRDPLNGLLQAINYLGMYEGPPAQPAAIRTQCGSERQAAQQAGQSPLRQHAAAAYASLLSPCGGDEPSSVPSSPPATPPRSCQKGRPGQRSPTKRLRSPTVLRAQGGVSKARSPTLHERLAHSQRAARSNASGGSSTTSSSPATSGTIGGTVTGSGSHGGDTGATSQIGSWTEVDKAALLAIVQQVKPCGAVEWEAVANRLGRWSKGGASAERMFRTLADPQYQKSSNRHGCRLNPRTGTPMHVMVEYALQRLPGNEGNIDAIAKIIEANPEFARQLDYSARPGTKTYPRWKDTLLGCFKAGRYRHLLNTHLKVNGKNVYRLVAPAAT